MVRHKKIQTALGVGKSSEWNDDHIADFTDVLTLECDFVNQAISNFWNTAQTSGGSAPIVTFFDHHTMAVLNTGATTNNISSMRFMCGGAAGNITYVDDAPIISMAVGLTAFHTAGEVAEFGLIKSDTANAFTANQNGAYFRVDDNKLYGVTGTGAAETATDITPTLGIPAWAFYRVELTSANAKFYVDDMTTPVLTQTTTLPTDNMTIKFSIQSQNDVDSTMYADGCGLTRNKYSG